MVERVFTFGNPSDGVPFDEQTNIRSIGLGGGSFLDRIIINGTVFGGPGGVAKGPLVLDAGENFSMFKVYSGQFISRIWFETNADRQLSAGQVDYGSGGMYIHVNSIIGISGRLSHLQAGQLVVGSLTIRADFIRETVNHSGP